MTLLDYPGKLAATVFVAGCNFRCPFCHNKDLVLPELAKKLKTYKETEIFDFLENRKGKLEAVCITGGEPTLYKDLLEFIKKIKSLGYLVKLDTNGTNPEMVEELIKQNLLDYVAVDYKGPMAKYHKYTNIQINKVGYYSSSEGVPSLTRDDRVEKFQKVSSRLRPVPYGTGLRSNDNIIGNKIKRTIEILLKSGIDFELRTTVVSTLHSREDLIEMAKDLKKLLVTNYGLRVTWYLQQFRPKNCLNPEFDKIKPYDKKWLEEILKELKKYFPETKLRNI